MQMNRFSNRLLLCGKGFGPALSHGQETRREDREQKNNDKSDCKQGENEAGTG